MAKETEFLYFTAAARSARGARSSPGKPENWRTGWKYEKHDWSGKSLTRQRLLTWSHYPKKAWHQLKKMENLNTFGKVYPKNASNKAMSHRTMPSLSLCARSMMSHTSVLKVKTKKPKPVWYLENHSHLLELCHLLQSLYLYCTSQGKSEHSAVFIFFLSLHIFMYMKSYCKGKHLCFYCYCCMPSISKQVSLHNCIFLF